MLRRLLVASILTSSVALLAFAALGSADSAPSGQRLYGNSSWDPVSGHFVGGGGAIEPAFDDSTGTLVYLRTPNNTQNAKNLPDKMVPFGDLGFSLPVNVAPIFLPVYPAGSGIDPTTLNCDHVVPLNPGPGTGDNCIDHGNTVAFVAGLLSSAYSGGVLGHDHLVGIASTGGDFNVLWEPVLVLFKNVDPNQERITTLDQIEAAYKAGTIFFAPAPQLTFHCSAEGSAAYDKATPAPIG
jgi:hypothetical protein